MNENERWKPKRGETFFYFSEATNFKVIEKVYKGELVDFLRFVEGVCYRTREEAEAAAERVRKAYEGGDKE